MTVYFSCIFAQRNCAVFLRIKEGSIEMYQAKLKIRTKTGSVTEEINVCFLRSRLKLTTKIENESFGEEQSHGSEDSQQTKNQQEQHQQYLGDTSQGLPEFKSVQITEPLPGAPSLHYIFQISSKGLNICDEPQIGDNLEKKGNKQIPE